jgi:hypothetical protein
MSDLYDKIKEDVAFDRKWAGTVRLRVRVVLSCAECTENRPKNEHSKSSVNN